ncbi:Eco57I restriction-modification methylase domain-containing protein [Rhizobium rhizogenes]|uniref:Eco57I restriction-modification methylase domain-containing protein n=1 Tax=Rhizobium rhizogenes TaxID=359 RepID=UPI001A9C6A61|nr:Eco57I restriction-modification methylase domain-containing protein [Rhizobium rhizogenes]
MRLLKSYAPQFPGFNPLEAAVAQLANAGIEERGAIYTRLEVVDFILDLVGYTVDRPLHTLRILEPSFGDGDFLLPIIDRLLTSYREHMPEQDLAAALRPALRGVELHRATFETTRDRVLGLLAERGVSELVARVLADAWLSQGDFLLEDFGGDFTHVVGNPPYVRQELIPDELMAEYRRRYATIYDRADIYVPFIEHSLGLLAPGGALGFICADRWMKNRYGTPLRKLVADQFHLRTYVDMMDTPAFHTEVSAYPAIFIIANERGKATRLYHRPKINGPFLASLATALTAEDAPTLDGVKEIQALARGAEPWVLESFDQLAVVRRLEAQFPTLEEAGCKVGIGVATGADKVFTGPFDKLDVEDDRKLPMAMAKDIHSGQVEWHGKGVINPFDEKGGLVPLDKYPRLARYFEQHGAEIKNRHVSKKNPNGWYRTIDRIYPSLTYKPKLLIPDIKSEANIVYEPGKLYPHHNLYYITSDDWDIQALQAVLLSGIARLFVAIYSTKMRGGYLRFQAQYLRRIRVPHWKDVPLEVRQELLSAAQALDIQRCNEAVAHLYRLSPAERAAMGGNGTI